jgi:hypothetical protein
MLPDGVTVQTDGVVDANDTGRPDVDVANSWWDAPKVCEPGFVNWIVCVPCGVTLFDAADATPGPALVVAVTVKV